MKKYNPGFDQIVKDAKTRVKEIDVDAVKKLLDNKEKVIVIDVREESEWLSGHVPQALYLSKGIIERDIEKVIPDYAQKLVLYCGGGGRSALVADNLQKMGYQQVLSMAGGMGAWKQATLPIVRD